MLTGFGYNGKYLLIDEITQKSIAAGAVRETFRGERCKVDGGRPPHKPGSTGRVLLADGREVFPAVIGAKWIRA
jgi:hypothetical protein